MKTAYEIVYNEFDHAIDVPCEKISMDEAVTWLKLLKIDDALYPETELPEDLSAETLMELWNELVDEQNKIAEEWE